MSQARIRAQRAEREAQQAEDDLERLEREAWLAGKEDKVTSPRTQRRRVLHRDMHRALTRQREGYIICRWGCGQWMKSGQPEFHHQRDLCPRRIIQVGVF